MNVCDRCRAGKHSHDRWTEQGKPGFGGTDAGCPFVAPNGQGCQCSHVVEREIAPQRCPTCGGVR